MKIVARCPFCRQKIRFPVNKGKILIRCPKCRNQFMFDPSIKRMASMLVSRIKNFFSRCVATVKQYMRKR